MPITNKSATSPAEKYYTTAPKDYDWGWTKVLIENAGKDSRGKVYRLVEIADGYHADFQTGRYGSGNYPSLTPAEFQKQVRLELITETPADEQIVTLTKDFDWSGIIKPHADDESKDNYDAVRTLVRQYGEGDSPILAPLNGGLGSRLTVRGVRPEATATFNEVVAKCEAIIKGS